MMDTTMFHWQQEAHLNLSVSIPFRLSLYTQAQKLALNQIIVKWKKVPNSELDKSQ
jgi:hypothetical protein